MITIVGDQIKNTEWLDEKIPLETHHKNGESKDNSVDNVMLVCPNCHAKTDNYKAKNKNCDRDMRKYYHRKREIVLP